MLGTNGKAGHLVEVLEHGGEVSARRAPVRRKVEEDQVLAKNNLKLTFPVLIMARLDTRDSKSSGSNLSVQAVSTPLSS